MNDKASKIIGAATFFLGIAILAVVVYIVFCVFLRGDDSLAAALKDTSRPLGDVLSGWAAGALVRLVMLVFMTAAGSVITEKGLRFYFASKPEK
ncbi:MAG: hypothetical protein ILO36_04990 [Abditibacteriota bacterium]|nr:hypothetical protein [Abditibacteriota bacterium]